MAMLAFDTHAVFKNLQAAGFTETQAEGVTAALRQAREAALSDLPTKADHAEFRADVEQFRITTKADIEALRQSTKADIEALRQSTKADIENARLATDAQIANLKNDLIKWVIGAVGFQVLAVLGAFVGLARVLAR